MYQGNGSLIEIFLVVVLVFDEVAVAKVAHVRTGIPTNTLCVYVDLSQHPDHLRLISSIRFRAGCGRGGVDVLAFIMCLVWYFDDGEWESVGDFECAVNVHAHKGAGRGGRKPLRTMLYDLHDHLRACQHGGQQSRHCRIPGPRPARP